MANRIILDYLGKYGKKYRLEDLKRKIVSSGYDEREVDEAINILGLNKPKEASKPAMALISGEMSKKGTAGGRKWMKFAGIIGIVFLALSVVGSILGFILPKTGVTAVPDFLSGVFGLIIFFILFAIGIAAVEVFYYGFLKLGKHTNSKLLRFAAKTLMIMMVVLVILAIVGVIVVFSTVSAVISGIAGSGLLASPALSPAPLSGLAGFTTLFLVIGGIGLLAGLFILVVQILFCVGLIRIKGVKFSKLAGFLGLALIVLGIVFSVIFISAFTVKTTGFIGLTLEIPVWITIIQISLSVLALAHLLLLCFTLFDASKKFESD